MNNDELVLGEILDAMMHRDNDEYIAGIIHEYYKDTFDYMKRKPDHSLTPDLALLGLPVEVQELIGRRQGSRKWIQKAHLKKGAFSRQAKAHHESVHEFEGDVLSHPERYSKTTQRRARLAKTFEKMRK